MEPELMEHLIEEVLVRFPPEDPAFLVRAALVCKCWCRLISSAGFRRRFRQFHGRAPMLGFFNNALYMSSDFVPISSACPPLIGDDNLTPVDARHGRVLFHSGPSQFRKRPWKNAFIVWDTMTGERRELPLLPRALNSYNSWNAAVLCAATPTGTCDHLDCYRGPLCVVLVGIRNVETFAYVYSSEAGSWSEPTYAQQPYFNVTSVPSALVGNSLYFVLHHHRSILKYDLGTQEMSTIDLPPDCINTRMVLMGTEDGGLGFALVENFKLYLWLRKAGPDATAGWTQSKAVELRTALPIGAQVYSPLTAGFADRIGVIFLRTSDGIFTIDPKSIRVMKICEKTCINYIVPYMSFYIPAFEASSTADGPTDQDQVLQVLDKLKKLT